MSFFAELKRRKVFRVAMVYAAVAFALASVADLLFPTLLLPDVVNRALVVLLVMGFPVALVLAWAFELKPEGAAPDVEESSIEDRATERWSIPVLVGLLAVGLIAGTFLGRFVGEPADSEGADSVPVSVHLPIILENYVDDTAHFQPHRFALSPDGTQIAYVGRDRDDTVLYLKPKDGAEPRVIPNSSGAKG